MREENGFFYMAGPGKPGRGVIETPLQALGYIKKMGLVPLFACDIEGLSLEEHTLAGDWWCDDASRDPWEWRKTLAESGQCAYGKFFGGRMGFVSPELLPYLCALRRAGYDFDSRVEEGLVPQREAAVMRALESEGKPSYIIRREAGFGKDGFKGYDGVLAKLQQQTYVAVRGFTRKRNRAGGEYGWSIALYDTPERIFGGELVRSQYALSERAAAGKLTAFMRNACPKAADEDIAALIGAKGEG